ncbi:aminotransferase class V-fold PLP-dependent enzyme [Zunongwangia sp.]|uniref:aminotransferase class V-fold PLP-dependent enzyme n=1 Tax=Zunongwangia sp. TaxID=1965325 RepID=UPI003AA83B25
MAEQANNLKAIDQNLEEYFKTFREKTIGTDYQFTSYYGKQHLLYADWIASGRLYQPIEEIICKKIGPLMANTHSFSSESGKAATYAYKEARGIIKDHVNANEDDILVTTGTGMTGALAKLHRFLQLQNCNDSSDRPVVFITHMEHHSNQVSWMELDVDVVIVEPNEDLQVSAASLRKEIEKYKNRSVKIGAFSGCSNVTGAITPFYELAEIMHENGGLCFVDFAASAPYQTIDMHPENKNQQLDAIFFSPHKFLGGPGTCGILVFNKNLYKAVKPDNPGGGNVKWTNPWGEYGYNDDIEVREDGGTPGILQVMRTALCLRLKDQMNPRKMHLREEELLRLFYKNIADSSEIELLGKQNEKRIGCISFNISGMHYNLVVRLLNDRFGIQVRGGWSCASSYAHYFFKIKEESSAKLVKDIETKNLTNKPGWVRVSLHPIMTDKEVNYITDSIKAIIENKETWSKDYTYNKATNEFDSVYGDDSALQEKMKQVFELQ